MRLIVYSLLLAFATLMASCGGVSEEGLFANIAALEDKMKSEELTAEERDSLNTELLNQFNAYLTNFKGSEREAEVLHKASLFSAETHKVKELFGFVDQLIDVDPAYSGLPDVLMAAGEEGLKLKMGSKSIAYFDAIYTKFPSADGAPKALYLRHFVYANLLRDQANATKDKAEFDSKYPERIAEMIYMSGEVAMAIGMPEQALSYFQSLHKSYPNYERAAYALFLQGYIYENYLGQQGNAEEVYRQFLAAYPEHELYQDVQFSVANLGKTPEELLQEIQAKEEANAS